MGSAPRPRREFRENQRCSALVFDRQGRRARRVGRRGRARRARQIRRPGGPGPCRRARHGVQPALLPAPPPSPACWGFSTLVSHATVLRSRLRSACWGFERRGFEQHVGGSSNTPPSPACWGTLVSHALPPRVSDRARASFWWPGRADHHEPAESPVGPRPPHAGTQGRDISYNDNIIMR